MSFEVDLIMFGMSKKSLPTTISRKTKYCRNSDIFFTSSGTRQGYACQGIIQDESGLIQDKSNLIHRGEYLVTISKNGSKNSKKFVIESSGLVWGRILHNNGSPLAHPTYFVFAKMEKDLFKLFGPDFGSGIVYASVKPLT